MKGQIKKILSAKKCGFIRGEDGKDYFFHASACMNVNYDELQQDQDVIFEPRNSQRGPRTEDVRI